MTVLNDLDQTCGISDEKLTELFKESIRIDDEIRKIKGLPVARFVRICCEFFFPTGERGIV